MARESVRRYPVPLVEGPLTIDMPEHSDIIAFAYQDGVPWLWVMVDQDMNDAPVSLYLARSNSPLPGDADYYHVGTAIPESSNGSEVWHLLQAF